MGPTLAPVTKERDGDLASRGGQSPLLVRVTVRRTAVGTRIERTGTVRAVSIHLGSGSCRDTPRRSASRRVRRSSSCHSAMSMPPGGHVELKDARDLFLGVEVNVRIG